MSCVRNKKGVIPIFATAGDTYTESWTFVNPIDDSPIDLSGYVEIAMQVRRVAGAEVMAEAKLSEGTFTVSGVGHNILNVELTFDPTMVGDYKHDVEFYTTTEKKKTLLEGPVCIDKQITVITTP